VPEQLSVSLTTGSDRGKSDSSPDCAGANGERISPEPQRRSCKGSEAACRSAATDQIGQIRPTACPLRGTLLEPSNGERVGMEETMSYHKRLLHRDLPAGTFSTKDALDDGNAYDSATRATVTWRLTRQAARCQAGALAARSGESSGIWRQRPPTVMVALTVTLRQLWSFRR